MSLFEKRVEAGARVIWEMDNTTLGISPPESLEAWEYETEGYLELARAALRAADAVVTEEQIAETILKALVFTSENSEAWADGLARDIAALSRGGAK